MLPPALNKFAMLRLVMSIQSRASKSATCNVVYSCFDLAKLPKRQQLNSQAGLCVHITVGIAD